MPLFAQLALGLAVSWWPKSFNERFSQAFDAVLHITTIAVKPPPVGKLDLISAKVRIAMRACPGHCVRLPTSCSCCLFASLICARRNINAFFGQHSKGSHALIAPGCCPCQNGYPVRAVVFPTGSACQAALDSAIMGGSDSQVRTRLTSSSVWFGKEHTLSASIALKCSGMWRCAGACARMRHSAAIRTYSVGTTTMLCARREAR